MLLCPTVVQIEQIVLDYPIKLLESPEGPSPEEALDLTGAVSEVCLGASTVALGEHAACSIPRCVSVFVCVCVCLHEGVRDQK